MNGVHIAATAANVRLAQPAGYATYTFTAPFAIAYQGQHLSYRKGQTVHLAGALLTTLTARAAPMVLVP